MSTSPAEQDPGERVAGDTPDTDAFVSDPAAAERATKERMGRQAEQERQHGGPSRAEPGRPDVSPGAVPAPEDPQPVPDVQPVPGVTPDPARPGRTEPLPGDPLTPEEPDEPPEPEPLDPPQNERPPL